MLGQQLEKRIFYLWNKALRIMKRTYLLTAWSRVLLEKLTSSQSSQEIPSILLNPRFIIAFTTARHLSLSPARSIQSMPCYSTSWRSILILSSCLWLGLPGGLFPSGYPANTMQAPLLSPIHATSHAHPSRFDHLNKIWWWAQIPKLLIL